MKPVVTAVMLVTEDGVPIDALHMPALERAEPGELPARSVYAAPADRDSLGLVVAHGFTMSWQRPWIWRSLQRFNYHAGVVTFDFRGHGRSGGMSTLGDKEVNDVDVAVRYARQLGYQRVATIGFSMGASVVLRQAALRGGVDAVVSVSGPGRWYYRDTMPMRRVHFAAERRLGRYITRQFLHTRVSPEGWPTPDPMPPAEAAALISPAPLLIVHGDQDIYFPPEHGQQLYDAAREPKEYWMLPGFGHAERHTDDRLIDKIVEWIEKATADTGTEPDAAAPADAGTPVDTELAQP